MSRLSGAPGPSGGRAHPNGAWNEQMLSLGRLSFLASFCPLHRNYPAAALARLFIPAVNHGCVRFFDNEEGRTCAALIWARLAEEVSERMVFDNQPPAAAEWASGENLWFLDILAPFGHGRTVARHIARHPPDGPFYFARLGDGGQVRKIVRGEARAPRRRRVRAYFVEPAAEEGR